MDRRGPELHGAPCLTLGRFGFAFGERTVVRSIDLAIPSCGLFTLLGPVSAGKSSLLRLLAGEMPSQGSCQSWGTASYLDVPLGQRGWPALAGQRARLVMGTVLESVISSLRARERLTRLEQRETVGSLLKSLGLSSLCGKVDTPVVELSSAEQRCLLLASAFSTGADLVCADEPTAGLPEAGRAEVIALLRRMAEDRAVLLVTHNLGDLRELGGEMALLAGGVLQERASVADFLHRPASRAGEQFVRTGSCAVPSPDAVAEEIDPSVSLPEADGATLGSPPGAVAPSRPPPPRSGNRVRAMAASIKWVVPGKLAGIRRPGLLRDLDDDLSDLTEERISVLVCLEETQPIPAEALHRHGIQSIWLPVRDMAAPEIAETSSLCARIERLVEAGHRVAVHCKGGLGRTGTLLAAYFICRGATKPEALSAVRRVEPRFVQSTEQLAFLLRFSTARAGGAAADGADAPASSP